MDPIDPRLGSDFNKNDVMVMIEAALVCTNVTPSVRPNMSSVVRMLEGDEAVRAVVPDSSVGDDSEKLEAMRRHFMGRGEEEDGEPSGRTVGSSSSSVPLIASSASSKDLYPAAWDSDYWQKQI